MSDALTVADSKRVFHAAFPHVIAPLYRRMVDELLVELHLLSRQKGFHPDRLFAVGLVQVFDSFSQGYRPAEQRLPLFHALCLASGYDADAFRAERDGALASIGQHRLEEVQGWIDNKGAGAPEPIASTLTSMQRPDFHYSRLMAVGLLCLLEHAQGADSLDPAELRRYAHDLGTSMGLLQDRLDKDLNLYAANLEKMALAVELMEETVAAERRRRERQSEPLKTAAAAELKAPGEGLPSPG